MRILQPRALGQPSSLPPSRFYQTLCGAPAPPAVPRVPHQQRHYLSAHNTHFGGNFVRPDCTPRMPRGFVKCCWPVSCPRGDVANTMTVNEPVALEAAPLPMPPLPRSRRRGGGVRFGVSARLQPSPKLAPPRSTVAAEPGAAAGRVRTTARRPQRQPPASRIIIPGTR